MKICWDNLEKISLANSGKYFLHINGNKYYEFDACPECGESYLGQREGYCNRQCSIKNNEKMIGSFFGRTHSKKSREKNRLVHLGISAKNYNYPDRTGENNPNWKGGISEHRKYYRTKEYENWRKSVFEKDNYTCWNCAKTGGKLQAHHVYEVSKFPHLMYETSNGITLHEKYHRSIRGKESEFRSDFL